MKIERPFAYRSGIMVRGDEGAAGFCAAQADSVNAKRSIVKRMPRSYPKIVRIRTSTRIFPILFPKHAAAKPIYDRIMRSAAMLPYTSAAPNPMIAAVRAVPIEYAPGAEL